MSNLITTQIDDLAARFDLPPSEELYSVLKSTAFKGDVSDAQLSALLLVAKQYGLNPWLKEIYAYPDKGAIIPIVGVDGWARIINNNLQFDGMEFEQDADSCTCTMYRKDRTHPTKLTEWMAECKRESAGPWKTHPYRMLRHKAMIQCARMAFGFSGIYDHDEAERIVEGKANMPIVKLDELLDVKPFVVAALLTKTDKEAAEYWKTNNAKFAKQPGDHATLKQTIIDHRMAMKEADITDVEVNHADH